MLSALADVFRGALSKSNQIYHFRLNFPLTQMKMDSISQELRRIRSYNHPKIALSLNAAQGPYKQYEALYSQFRRMNQQFKIPVYCFLQDQVTTDGYMLACCANQILANPFSIIGDIGAYSSYINIGNLLKKFNIKYQNLGLSKGLYNKFADPIHEQKAQKVVDQDQKTIINRISERRDIKIQEIQKIKGKLFNAEEALSLKLIDGIGTYPQWKAQEKRQSQEFPIGFSSFQLNFTMVEQALFSKLFKLSAQQPLNARQFIQQNKVIQEIVKIVSNRSDDSQVLQFVDSKVAPLILSMLQK